jgi:hypothetical protein
MTTIPFVPVLAVAAVALSFWELDVSAQVRQNCEEIRITGRPAYDLYLKCVVSQLPPLDPKRREWFGEEYDPKKYYECRKDLDFVDMRCEKYRLVRRHEPEYWPYAGKVAPVKWPEAPKQSVYRKGMKPQEYFEALCKAEAGEFIYKTVDNGEGIYQIRPRARATPNELRDRYVMEDPYGYTDQEASDPELALVGPKLFRFLETPRLIHARFGIYSSGTERAARHESFFVEPPERVIVARYAGFNQNDFRSMIRTFDKKLDSRYGYTWKGIKRENDRELGIAGGEVIVVDLHTNEIIALWRGFAQNRSRTVPGPTISWESAPACPSPADVKFSKDFIAYFLTKTLVSKAQ